MSLIYLIYLHGAWYVDWISLFAFLAFTIVCFLTFSVS
jgi:hypothetical protein